MVGRRWQATRRAVFARYGRVCWHCGLALRRDLDALRCEHRNCSNCGPLALHARCHPEAPTWCEYERGQLILHCSECGSRVVCVAIAG